MRLRTSIAVLALLLAAACERDRPRPPPIGEPPNLGGVVFDDAGVGHSLVMLLGVIAFGDAVEGRIPAPRELVGWEFEASQGAIPVIELAPAADGARVAVSLYGPRQASGVWGTPLATAASERGSADPLVLDDHEILEHGMYLILLQNISRDDRADGGYDLRLGCRGACGAPTCPDIEACGLVCRRGFQADAEGCRLCACVEPAACEPGDDSGCAEGEVCDERGQCVPAADPCAECVNQPRELVCGADWQTYGNPCRARCAGVEIVRPGACPECDGEHPCPDGERCERGQCVTEGVTECGVGRPCPEGEVCDRDGRCVPERCPCDPVDAPVCSREGHTWRNECEMRCREEVLAYRGPCRRDLCRIDADCEGDEACLPVADLEGNLRRCAEDPRSEECVRACQRRDRACDAEHPCADGQYCYGAAVMAHGLCLPLCRLAAEPGAVGACPVGGPDAPFQLVCAAVRELAAREGVGLCLPGCAERGACPQPLMCLPDLREAPVCQLCMCDDAAAGPVCGADGVTYASPCRARCAGVVDFREGRCPDVEPDDCLCSAEPQPFCGDDGVIYNTVCEARCYDAMPIRDKSCFAGRAMPLGCRVDADCFRTGTNNDVCASARTDFQPRHAPDAACLAQHGACGCVDNFCMFRLTDEARRCAFEN